MANFSDRSDYRFDHHVPGFLSVKITILTFDF